MAPHNELGEWYRNSAGRGQTGAVLAGSTAFTHRDVKSLKSLQCAPETDVTSWVNCIQNLKKNVEL